MLRMLLVPAVVLTSWAYTRGAGWEYSPSLITQRELHGVAKGGDGLIYAIGGSTHYPWNKTSTVEAFNEGTGEWSYVDELNEPRTNLSAGTDGNGSVYAIGGISASGYETSVEYYDPDFGGPWEFVAPTQTPHVGGGVTTDVDGHIWAIGGATASVEVYDHIADTWTYAESLPSTRSSFASVTDSEGRIYVIGGVIDGGPSVSDVLRYDPAHPELGWSPIANMPTARQLLAAVVDGSGNIWAIGGSGSGWVTGLVEIYDPEADVWSDGPSLQQPRNALGAVLSDLEDIYAVGGGKWTSPLNVVESIPEPATLSLLVLGGLIVVRRRQWQGHSQRRYHKNTQRALITASVE